MEDIIKEIKTNISIDFDSVEEAKIVYESVLLEFETSPDFRSTMDIMLSDKSIIINILSEDATSLRASVNSAIKWIKLSHELVDLLD